MLKPGFVTNVTSMNIGQSWNNPLSRLFGVKKQTGSCGVEMPWKIYDAIRLVDGMECSLFIFEKRIAEKLHKPRRKELICEFLRKEVSQLQNFNHSKILKVLHPLEENNDTIAFATERIIGSLANLLGNDMRLSHSAIQDIKKRKLTDLEIKHGIYQLTDCLRYLHTSQQVIHSNVNPSTVLITESGHWKMFGTGFVTSNSNFTEEQISEMQWSPKKPKMTQPDLDYVAPEIQLGGPITSSIDMFSLGLVICSAYCGGKTLINANKVLSNYLKKIEELHKEFSQIASILPQALVEPVEKMLNKEIRYRPNSQLFSLLKYFDDMILLSIDGIVNFEEKDSEEKLSFLQSLPEIISEYPKELLNTRVFPFLLHHLMESRDLYVACFELLMATVQYSTLEQFLDHMKPGIIGILNRAKANSINESTTILQFVEPLFYKMSNDDVQQELVPLLVQCINSDIVEAQTAALDSLKFFKGCIDDQTLNNIILPKIKFILNRRKIVKVRCSALSALGVLVSLLEKSIIIEDVIPFLCEIKTTDIDIVMCIIQNYKEMMNKRLKISKELIIQIIQSLLVHITNPLLKRQHIRCMVDILHSLIDKIDSDQMDSFESNSEQKSDTNEMSFEMSEKNQCSLEDDCELESEIERIKINLSPRFNDLDRNSSIRTSFTIGPQTMRKVSAPILRVNKNLCTGTNLKSSEKSIKATSFIIGCTKDENNDYKKPVFNHRRRQTIDASMGLRLPVPSVSSTASSSYRLNTGKNMKIIPRNIVFSAIAQSQITDEEKTLLKQQMTPPPMGRRHSFAFSSFPDSPVDLITASVCEGPFQHPASNKIESRRWQPVQRDSNVGRLTRQNLNLESNRQVSCDKTIKFYCIK